jgi:hypothetical protein
MPPEGSGWARTTFQREQMAWGAEWKAWRGVCLLAQQRATPPGGLKRGHGWRAPRRQTQAPVVESVVCRRCVVYVWRLLGLYEAAWRIQSQRQQRHARLAADASAWALTRRLCTRPTLGLHDDAPAGNVSAAGPAGGGAGAAARRLAARNSVTALFGAERLWAAGFRGAGVRMGVFDTGIRADHPHVKNIRRAAAPASGPRACPRGAAPRAGPHGAARAPAASLGSREKAAGDGRARAQGAHELDARADAGGRAGPRHLRGRRGRRAGRRVPRLCAGGGAVHLPRLHQ